MATRFNPNKLLSRDDSFSDSDVGITHEDNQSFIKINDNGDIEIFAGEGLGIILHPNNRSITFVADKVRFATQENNGFIWNKLSLNPQAISYAEPALVEYDNNDETKSLYRNLEDYV